MVKLRGREAYPFYFGAGPEMLRRAAELRANMTSAEKALWAQLRKRNFCNQKFRRQHPIGNFIVDFFCYEAMLVIELDGEVHTESYQNERDLERTKILNDLGITVLRFRNEEVFMQIETVLINIKQHLASTKPCN